MMSGEADASALQAEAKRKEAEATLAVSKSELAEARAYAAVRKQGQARGLLSSEERRVADSAVRVIDSHLEIGRLSVLGAPGPPGPEGGVRLDGGYVRLVESDDVLTTNPETLILATPFGAVLAPGAAGTPDVDAEKTL